MSLSRILAQQASLLNIEKYENELEMIKQINAMPSAGQEICRELSLQWISSLNNGCSRSNNPEDLDYMINLSIQFRNQGNGLFKKKNRNLFQVANLYTKAILTAPIGEALAIAHANRGVALLEIGYYQAAYDDCMVALEHNYYPEHLLPKLVARQAHCASKLKNVNSLRLHLSTLDGMSLNENLQRQCKELYAQLEHLTQENDVATKANENAPSDNVAYKIVQSDGADGVHAIATKSIRDGELIFRERIPAFVSVEDWCMCQECARTQIIPFPCTSCSRVVYCSLKCRMANEEVHRYECQAFDKNIPANIGIGALAFRIFLKGLPQILPFVRDKTTAEEIWKELTGNGALVQNKDIEYSQTLRMITHLEKITLRDIVAFALIAKLIVLFLKEHTSIFQLMEGTAARGSDWELVSAAIILRHIGQLIVNGHAYISLTPAKDSAEYTEFSFLSHTLWSGPFCVQRGKLHRFSNYQQVGAVNLPHLSLLNHSCIQSIETKYNGQYANVYAVKDIPAGEQIYNCYTTNCRKMRSKTRRADLENTYNFICQCNQCMKDNPDEEYELFHRYLCENPSCMQVFVPHILDLPTLEWWREEVSEEFVIKCTFCASVQNMEWLTNFENSLENITNQSIRLSLYEKFNQLSKWLEGSHKLKMYLGTQLIEECFELLNDGAELESSECDKLAIVIKTVLQGAIEEAHPKCIEYTAKMTYLWDLIALNKYSCSREEMDSMLETVEFLSDEYKEIFLNYYENYIESNVSKQSA